MRSNGHRRRKRYSKENEMNWIKTELAAFWSWYLSLETRWRVAVAIAAVMILAPLVDATVRWIW